MGREKQASLVNKCVCKTNEIILLLVQFCYIQLAILMRPYLKELHKMCPLH